MFKNRQKRKYLRRRIKNAQWEMERIPWEFEITKFGKKQIHEGIRQEYNRIKEIVDACNVAIKIELMKYQLSRYHQGRKDAVKETDFKELAVVDLKAKKQADEVRDRINNEITLKEMANNEETKKTHIKKISKLEAEEIELTRKADIGYIKEITNVETDRLLEKCKYVKRKAITKGEYSEVEYIWWWSTDDQKEDKNHLFSQKVLDIMKNQKAKLTPDVEFLGRQLIQLQKEIDAIDKQKDKKVGATVEFIKMLKKILKNVK